MPKSKRFVFFRWEVISSISTANGGPVSGSPSPRTARLARRFDVADGRGSRSWGTSRSTALAEARGGGWVVGDVDMHEFSPVVPKDQEPEEQAEGEGGDDDEFWFTVVTLPPV